MPWIAFVIGAASLIVLFKLFIWLLILFFFAMTAGLLFLSVYNWFIDKKESFFEKLGTSIALIISAGLLGYVGYYFILASQGKAPWF